MQHKATRPSRPVEVLHRAWLLFFFFFRIGFFTFGGGWSIIAQMTREFVEKRKWLTNEELMDMVSVAQSLPGIMIINCSVQFGYALGGVFCAFAAALGTAIAMPQATRTSLESRVRNGVVVQDTPARFFAQGSFYTTTANRIVRQWNDQLVTWEEVARWVEQNTTR